jgi:integrase
MPTSSEIQQNPGHPHFTERLMRQRDVGSAPTVSNPSWLSTCASPAKDARCWCPSRELLQAGVDCSVIALWLGHESVETTQTYLHTHLALKEAALAKLKPYQRGKQTRFRPSDPPARLP